MPIKPKQEVDWKFAVVVVVVVVVVIVLVLAVTKLVDVYGNHAWKVINVVMMRN